MSNAASRGSPPNGGTCSPVDERTVRTSYTKAGPVPVRV